MGNMILGGSVNKINENPNNTVQYPYFSSILGGMYNTIEPWNSSASNRICRSVVVGGLLSYSTRSNERVFGAGGWKGLGAPGSATGGNQQVDLLVSGRTCCNNSVYLFLNGAESNSHPSVANGEYLTVKPNTLISGTLNLQAVLPGTDCMAHFVNKFSVGRTGSAPFLNYSQVIGTDWCTVGLSGPVFGVSAGACALTISVNGFNAAFNTLWSGHVSVIETSWTPTTS
jgi:hypothetical protein